MRCRSAFIANDGNLVVNPILLTSLDEQGVAERYDIIVDFSQFRIGDKRHAGQHAAADDGRKPTGSVSLAQALAGSPRRSVLSVRSWSSASSSRSQSVDVPGCHPLRRPTRSGPEPGADTADRANSDRHARAHARHRVGRAGTATRASRNGQCIPDCPETAAFPWTVKVNGQAAHSFNANRISAAHPQAGRDRALDLHQRRRRLGSPDPSSLRGRHHDEPGRRIHPGHRTNWSARTSGACAPPGRSSSRSSSANTAAPT